MRFKLLCRTAILIGLMIQFLGIIPLERCYSTGLDIAVNPHGAFHNPPTRTRPIVIAMVPKSLDNPVFIDSMETAELAASLHNVLLDWVAPFKVNPEMQVKIIEGLIREKVDGIAVSCSDPEKLRGVIAKAAAAGIKVATFDADCPGSKRIFYCGTDNYHAGWVCGQAMARLVTQKGLTQKPLKTAILTGGLKAANLNERIRGFKAATAGKIRLNYRALLACDDDTVTGARMVESYLKQHPDTEAFFFTGGWAFFGPTESMPIYQEWCQNGGIAVSMDTFYPVLQAAKKGFAQALVGQDFRKTGELTVSYLVCAIKGLPIPADVLDTGLEIADQSNFDRLLKQKKPWEMK